MQWVFARPTEEGARMLVYGALIGHDDSMLRDQARGAYTSCFKITEKSDFVLSKEGVEAQRRIWASAIPFASDDIRLLTKLCRAKHFRFWQKLILKLHSSTTSS
jgi:hypothetical protein